MWNVSDHSCHAMTQITSLFIHALAGSSPEYRNQQRNFESHEGVNNKVSGCFEDQELESLIECSLSSLIVFNLKSSRSGFTHTF